ncbi:translation initiation factor 2 [Actinoplanes sp. DH11]|uniref:translation initiation factor 2 n=1 Tax=Actinoplanes sp. DH11 TaxID=2857011 RepID=UPI001E550B3F|nr:translation initiation factor 2 [Actinoplanes sp. DH11]
MFHQHFLSAPGTDLGPLDSGERVLWQGRCAVAEYAFDEASSLPRWTLPEGTEVLVTDRRVRYTYADDSTVSNGELFWLWPQHLRVQPGNREVGRNATVTQIQLVCNGPGGSFPALVFAGGTLTSVGDADRLANVLRQAIARFRVENATEIGVPAPQARMLSRLVIGPEFNNFQGGPGQTVTLLGAVQVPAPEETAYEPDPAPVSAMPVSGTPVSAAPVSAAPISAAPVSGTPVSAAPVSGYPVSGSPVSGYPVSGSPVSGYPVSDSPAPVSAMPVSGDRASFDRPGRSVDAVRAEQARRAEQDSRYAEPDLASRAASLAARVASLVSASEDPDNPATRSNNLSAYLNADADPGAPR